MQQQAQTANAAAAAQAAAVAAMKDQQFVRQVCEETAVIRTSFYEATAKLGLNPVAGFGNFVLMRLESAEAATALANYLREQAIVVRVTRGYGLAHCIRVTLGTAEQMKFVVATLQNYAGLDR